MKNLLYLLTASAVCAESAEDILHEFEQLSDNIVKNISLDLDDSDEKFLGKSASHF